MGEESRAPRSHPSVALILHGAGRAGTERHVRGLAAGLARRGWKVHVIVSEDGPLCDELAASGVRVHRVSRPHRAAYLLGVARLLRRLRPDIVHTHTARLACLAARLAGAPAVLETRHGLPERIRPLYRWMPPARRWEALKCATADRILTVCASDARWLERAGLAPRKLRVVVNGIDPGTGGKGAAGWGLRSHWGLPEGRPLVGFIGRLCVQKAPARFLELVHRLLARDCEVLGVVCGCGPEEPALRRRAQRLGIEHSLRWLGEREDAASLPSVLDLLALPSLWEGLPYVLLEALQAGTAVVATPVGGVPELLRGEVLSRSCLGWEPESWSRRAAQLLYQPEESSAFRAHARRRARQHLEQRTIAEVEGIYRELLERAGFRRFAVPRSGW